MIYPKISSVCFSFFVLVQYFDGAFIGMQIITLHNKHFECFIQWRYQLACTRYPIGNSAVWYDDAFSFKTFLLAIQRKMVNIFINYNLREQTRTCNGFWQWSFYHRCYYYFSLSALTYFGRTYRFTKSLPASYSNSSVISSPIFLYPSAFCSGSMIISLRSRCSGSFILPGCSFFSVTSFVWRMHSIFFASIILQAAISSTCISKLSCEGLLPDGIKRSCCCQKLNVAVLLADVSIMLFL